MSDSTERIEEKTAGVPAVDDLLRMLQLNPKESQDGFESFEAMTLNRESSRIYGGQVLAQAIVAGAQSVAADRTMHSIHAYFVRPGDVDQPLSFDVKKLNDGRSFSTRRIQASQASEEIFSAIASYQTDTQGAEHSSPAPENIPDPESLPTVAELVGHVPLPIAQAIAFERPFDIRHVDPPLWLAADPERKPSTAIWFKAFAPLGDDPIIHQAAIAYASDYVPVEPGLRAHGKYWLEQGMKVASLDHAVWFHRPARADEWLLYVLDSPSAQDARSLATGKIFTAEGVHVATVAQETMLRLPEYRENITAPYQD